mgnify:CR=1 FL=1
MLRIHKQSRVEEDLEDIWLYSFEAHGEHQADKCHDGLTKGINSLIIILSWALPVMKSGKDIGDSRSITMSYITKSHPLLLQS